MSALARALALQAEDPSAGTLSPAGFALISILLAGALAAVVVPTLVRLRTRRNAEQRQAREARIAASGDPRFDPSVLAARIRTAFPDEIARRGGDATSARLGPVEIVRIWEDDGVVGFTAWVAHSARLPDGRGRAGRPRRRRELWRADLDGRIVGTAPATAGAEDLTAPPLPGGG